MTQLNGNAQLQPTNELDEVKAHSQKGLYYMSWQSIVMIQNLSLSHSVLVNIHIKQKFLIKLTKLKKNRCKLSYLKSYYRFFW